MRSLMRPDCRNWPEDPLKIIDSHTDDTTSGMNGWQEAGGDSPSQEVHADPIHGGGVLERDVLPSGSDRGRHSSTSAWIDCLVSLGRMVLSTGHARARDAHRKEPLTVAPSPPAATEISALLGGFGPGLA